jgi:hypothetical protein
MSNYDLTRGDHYYPVLVGLTGPPFSLALAFLPPQATRLLPTFWVLPVCLARNPCALQDDKALAPIALSGLELLHKLAVASHSSMSLSNVYNSNTFILLFSGICQPDARTESLRRHAT